MKRIIHIAFLSILLICTVFPQNKMNITLNLKFFLQGPFHNNLMDTSLRDKDLIPLSQPYKVLPWEYDGDETVDTIPEGAVDWILVEMSEEPNENAVVFRKACLLKSDGNAFDPNNKQGITLKLQRNEKYYVIVHHRNHLSIVSSVPIIINNSSISYDFTKSSSSVYGDSTLVNLGNGKFGMLAGDSDSNGIVNNLDFQDVANHIFQRGYLNCDLDMNGVVNVLDYGQTNLNITKKSFLTAKPNF